MGAYIRRIGGRGIGLMHSRIDSVGQDHLPNARRAFRGDDPGARSQAALNQACQRAHVTPIWTLRAPTAGSDRVCDERTKPAPFPLALGSPSRRFASLKK